MTTAERAIGSLRRRAVLATVLAMAAAAAIGPAGTAKADARADLVDLSVVDRETGQPLRVWAQGARAFVAGQPGARYSLRVTNRTGGRVMVVMSVDGVNIVTGETAGYGQTGYVLEAYQSYDVTGWRKSNTEVAAFTFTPLANSYAARTGRPGDVGVIGLAAFRERVVAPLAVTPLAERKPAAPSASSAAVNDIVVTGQRIPAPAASRAAPAPPPAAKAAPSDEVAEAERRAEKLGTGHGAREVSVVQNVAFERATAYPQLIRRIEYDSYENLAANGVIPRPWDGPRPPRPFPKSGGGYVPDPPGRP